MMQPLEKLCKWRSILAGWHLGTRSADRPGVKAMRDLMDKWLIMRAETSALYELLIAKGVFTVDELTRQIDAEAIVLDNMMELQFPGFRTVSDGVEIYDAKLADETTKRLGFPP